MLKAALQNNDWSSRHFNNQGVSSDILNKSTVHWHSDTSKTISSGTKSLSQPSLDVTKEELNSSASSMSRAIIARLERKHCCVERSTLAVFVHRRLGTNYPTAPVCYG